MAFCSDELRVLLRPQRKMRSHSLTSTFVSSTSRRQLAFSFCYLAHVQIMDLIIRLPFFINRLSLLPNQIPIGKSTTCSLFPLGNFSRTCCGRVTISIEFNFKKLNTLSLWQHPRERSVHEDFESVKKSDPEHGAEMHYIFGLLYCWRKMFKASAWKDVMFSYSADQC